MFLTGQTLRVISEPPPPGSPKATPARTYMKAWENAYAWSNDKVLQGDVITYDSYKDLIYAYGENGRNVIFAEQYAPGQPTSPGSSKAVQLNPKTGMIHLINSDTLRMLDKKTGSRPGMDRADRSQPREAEEAQETVQAAHTEPGTKGFTEPDGIGDSAVVAAGRVRGAIDATGGPNDSNRASNDLTHGPRSW